MDTPTETAITVGPETRHVLLVGISPAVVEELRQSLANDGVTDILVTAGDFPSPTGDFDIEKSETVSAMMTRVRAVPASSRPRTKRSVQGIPPGVRRMYLVEEGGLGGRGDV